MSSFLLRSPFTVPLLLGVSLVCLFPKTASAAVPATYTGTPYMGTPWPIPGRIDFENYDDGGENVAWRVDDSTANFGVGGCQGNDYRTELPHPQICKSNAAEGDVYSAGPMVGQPYALGSLYIGYTHGADWVKMTVDVKTAGTYVLSSTWGSEPSGAGAIHFQILMNDVMKADVSLDGTGGYHNWVVYDNFAMVDLDAGVQVLQFAPKSMHLNYDYIQFSLMLPGGGVDPGGTGGAGGAGSGGASAGGASAGGAASGGTGGAPSGGTSGAASGGSVAAGGTAQGGQTTTGGSGGSLAAGGAPVTAVGGSGGSPPVGAAGSAGASAVAVGIDPAAAGASTSSAAPDVNSKSGCSFGVGTSSMPLGLISVGGLMAWAFSRRRRNLS
ncbi:MAG TPA: hypothetical protein VL137_09325, partial [Polyangiaceae bacterium]|nr:hypothetical protein [Polyangiaceae bacterium]